MPCPSGCSETGGVELARARPRQVNLGETWATAKPRIGKREGKKWSACVNALSYELTPSVVGHIFIFFLLIICQFPTASETRVGMKIVQILAINLLTSIEFSYCQ